MAEPFVGAAVIAGNGVVEDDKEHQFVGVIKRIIQHYWGPNDPGYIIQWRFKIHHKLKDVDGNIGIAPIDFSTVMRNGFKVL
jgi:hypothetical protein